MTDVETLRALLARVEGAAGADEVLDDDLWAAFGSQNDGSLYDYTASVDAALALVGRVMPDGRPRLIQQEFGVGAWNASILQGKYVSSVVGESLNAATPALALLAALLRAKIAETDNG